MNSRHYSLLSAATLLALAPVDGRAEAGNPLTDRFSVSLGGFLLDTGTEVRLDGAARTGTVIDVERDLGISSTDRFRIDGYWRFMDRHKIRLMYFDTRRSGSRQIDRDIDFGDTTYPINTQVDTTFETDVAELAYEYAFLRREAYEIAATIGLHNLNFEFALASAAGTLSESAEANGPLPVVGLHGVWRLGKHFYADAQVQAFKISVDPYDGRIEDYNVSLVWQAFSRVGFGIGYNEFVTRVDVDGDRFDGQLRWRYGGARIYVVGSF